jgi:hypothetical protein
MFQSFIKLGLLPENIFVLGKAYSSNGEIINEIKELGITVIQPEFNPSVSFDAQHKENCEQLWHLSELKRSGNQKLVVLDDGGSLLQVVMNNTCSFVGIEQTSSGFRKLEHSIIPVPIFNVARSKIKLEQETPYIARLGVKRIEEIILRYELRNPNILIVGMGPIGIETQRILSEKGYSISSYDKTQGERPLLELIKNNIQIIVGATGSQILSHEEIVELNDLLNERIILVSMSSSDREFELWRLRDLFVVNKSIHEDVEFGKIVIANNGFPITFKGMRIEAAPEQIERTICLLFSGVMLGIIKDVLPAGFVDIPEEILKTIE